MSLPVLSVAQMRSWESATWKTGQTEEAVIQLVGSAVARHVTKLTAAGSRILVLAGKGHNGDDARAAIPHLSSREVELLNVTNPLGDIGPLKEQLSKRPDLVIDALFGIGLNRSLSSEWCQFIEVLIHSGLPVMSIDVPSGLDASTGQHFGSAVEATITLTVGAPKSGLLAASAVNYVGRLEVAADVGLAPCGFDSELNWLTSHDFIAYPPARRVAGHKGTYGHVGIIAGSPGYHGAAVLTARGAQKAQPGLITLHAVGAAYGPVASQLQAVMVAQLGSLAEFRSRFDALLIGPGLAEASLAKDLPRVVSSLWTDSQVPLVVDASALAHIPSGKQPAPGLRVVTPHPGEAGRSLGRSAADVQADRYSAVRSLSAQCGGAWVVLKGHHTLIGRDEGPIYVNGTGNPHLAQGGSGDLLAGFIAGLLAQEQLATDPAKALAFAVWEHGAAADRLQGRGRAWTVEDLATELGAAS
jgi:NAD(P)H-hydrate epimerase